MTAEVDVPPRWHRRAILAGASLLLSGCSSLQLLPAPMEPQLYLLRPQTMTAMGPAVGWRLSVAAPEAAASLDTARIALTRSGNMMDYFANAAWTDRVPLLVQRLLIEAFENSMRILAVDRDTTGNEIDYILETALRNFEARYDAPDTAPEIEINMQAKIVRMPERVVVGSLSVAQAARASANTVDAVVAAFNQAAGAALGQITSWTLQQPPPPPGD